MNIEKFSKHFVDFVGNINVNGVTLKHNGEYTTKMLSYKDSILVPVFEIQNPNDIAFTKSAIEPELHREVLKFRNFIPGLENYRIHTLYEIEGDEYYIPEKVSKDLKNCLKNKTFKRIWTQPGDAEYKVQGFYTGGNEFYFGDEEIEWEIGFHLISVTKIIDDSGREEIMSDGDAREFFTDIKYEEREFFEDPIWPCTQPHLSTNKAFVDFDFMGWYTTPYLS